MAACWPNGDGTAKGISKAVETVFDEAHACVIAIRQDLTDAGEDPDNHVPLVAGGVRMHKIGGVMHDTCNAANAGANLILETVDRDRQAFYSAEELAALPEPQKQLIDFLCLKHARCLLGVQYERLSKERLKTALSDDLESHSSCERLEPELSSLMRSVGQLMRFTGAERYAKGDSEKYVQGRTDQVLVKWVGFDEPTWEPAANFTHLTQLTMPPLAGHENT